MSGDVKFSEDDIAGMRERFGDLDWEGFCSLWESYRDAEPSMGGCDVPHLFAVRFISRCAHEGVDMKPFTFYLALREAFFQAMTVVVETREPGKRYFK